MIGTVLVTLLAFAWVCLLPFRDDDYTLLRAALRPDAPSVDPLQYLYRPILFAWWRIVAFLTGVPLSPFAYHSAALLVHGLNAALLCLVVGRAGGSGTAALAAGLALGCLPMGGEAVVWISAGGDLLSTTFLLLALWFALALRRAPLPLYGLGLGTGAALCFLSKESGIVAAPIILAMAAAMRSDGRWRALLWSVVPLLVSLGIRRAATGSWSLRYAGGTAASWTLVESALRSVPDVAGALRASFADSAIPGIAVTVAGVGFVAAGCCLSVRRVATSVLVAAGLLAILSVPILFAHAVMGVVPDRATYPLRVPIAILAGTIVGALAIPRTGMGGRLARWVGWTSLVLLSTAGIHRLTSLARAEMASGDELRSVVRTIESKHASVSEDAALLILTDQDAQKLSPGLPTDLEAVFSWPFRQSGIPVGGMSESEATSHWALPAWPGPVMVGRWNDGQIVDPRILSALPDGDDDARLSMANGDGADGFATYTYEGSASPRAFSSIVIQGAGHPVPEEPMIIRVTTSSGVLAFEAKPRTTQVTDSGRLQIALWHDPAWALAERLVDIRLRGFRVPPSVALSRQFEEWSIVASLTTDPQGGRDVLVESRGTFARDVDTLLLEVQMRVPRSWEPVGKYAVSTAKRALSTRMTRCRRVSGVDWKGAMDYLTNRLPSQGVVTVEIRIRAFAQVTGVSGFSSVTTWHHLAIPTNAEE